MSLFSNESFNQLVIVMDVQSSLVRGSLVMLKRGALPNVIFTYTASVPWKPHTDYNYLVKMTLRAVSETMNVCLRNFHSHLASEHVPKKIGAIHYVLSSPWIVSQAKTLSTELPKEMVVTEAYVEKIIGEEKRMMLPSNEVDNVAIEQKIFNIKLNGYSVAEWVGKSALNIDVSYTISIANSRMIENLKDISSSAIHRIPVQFHSSTLLQFIGMRICQPNRGQYVLAHIHGEFTDVAVMDNHACIYFASYPLGVRNMIRKIALATGTDQHAADSLLTLYVGGHIDAAHSSGQIDAIHSIGNGWMNALKKALAEQNALSLDSSLDSLRCIISAVAHEEFFVKCLREAYPKSRVNTLSVEDILPHVAFSDRAERSRLVGVYAVALSSML